MRYFKASQEISNYMRSAVIVMLGQPNGRADEPWPITGDFTSEGYVYIALAPHQTEGEFWEPIIASAIQAGVEEITEQEYQSEAPVSEL